MKLLHDIQKKLKVPKVNKAQNYLYRNAEDILMAVKPILAEYSESATLILSDDLVLIGERYYVVAVATLSDGEKEVSAKSFAREILDKKNDRGKDIIDPMQLTLASSSYARKQALNGLFCLDDSRDEDDGANGNGRGNARGKGNNKNAPEPVSKLTLKKGAQEKAYTALAEAWYAVHTKDWEKEGNKVPPTALILAKTIYLRMNGRVFMGAKNELGNPEKFKDMSMWINQNITAEDIMAADIA